MSRFCFALLLVLVHTPLARGQNASPTSSLEGRILDSTQAPIAGAHVTAVADGEASGPSTTTDERGAFTLLVTPGSYTLTVTAMGFAEQSRGVNARPEGSSSHVVVLEVAGVEESVTVTAPGSSYQVPAIRSATKTPTPLIDVPQSVSIVTQELIEDQMMMSVGDVMRYVPGVGVHQGENNRDQIIMRGNSTSADFFIDGVRDDGQYYRDLYNLSRVEVLKGPSALIFGRGGAGGVVNRVEKEALFQPVHEVALQGGMYGNERLAADLGQRVSEAVAVRLNGMFEDSESFRTGVGLKRYGLTPTLTFTPSSRTKIAARYEFLHDTRVADRGIPSFQGRPVNVDPSTYYGNPADSHVATSVNVASVAIDHRAGAVTLRNHTSVANYDRRYQNYVPGAVSPDQSQVLLTAYNNASDRTNVFNQTDLTYAAATGAVHHTLLAGVEVGRQLTDNFRNTGFFNNATTSVSIPFTVTMITTPVTYRQSATDADNHLQTGLAATYVQDQVELSPHLQVLGGLRFDRFDLQFHNNRTGADLDRPDNLWSPRAGVVVKPFTAMSVYGSYSVSFLPSSGDQFSSLTAVTQQLQPERFNNYEVGVKWDAQPGLALTTALYRLDRTNTRSTDPNDPTRILQTGSQRTNGYEAGVNGTFTGAWSVAGGYAYQDAFVTSATAAAVLGAKVGQVPHHTFSLWNRYQFHSRFSTGLGVLYRSDMFVAVDNTVTLPGYARIDGAVFIALTRRMRLQANVENLLGKRYEVNADGNTNISPGFPRTLRVGVTTTF